MVAIVAIVVRVKAARTCEEMYSLRLVICVVGMGMDMGMGMGIVTEEEESSSLSVCSSLEQTA